MLLPILILLSACAPDVTHATDALPASRVAVPPTLTIDGPTGLIIGASGTFYVDGADPGETVYLAATARPPRTGPCPPALGGLCLDLGPAARVLSSVHADATGTAMFTVTLPAGSVPRGTVLSLQAAVIRGIDSGKTPLWTTVATSCGDGSGASRPALSCKDLHDRQPGATDGTRWIAPGTCLPAEAMEVYCDMSGGGWTLVYRATNSGGIAENGVVSGPDAIGTTPILPTSVGHFKLHDDVINALRSGSVANDLKVVLSIAGTTIGTSWHRSECALQSGVSLPAGDVCNQSTTGGPADTAWISSGHEGSLSRWYVDANLGYLWPYTHIGPIAGGWSHGGLLPDPFCTWYDSRVCPTASALEFWAL